MSISTPVDEAIKFLDEEYTCRCYDCRTCKSLVVLPNNVCMKCYEQCNQWQFFSRARVG